MGLKAQILQMLMLKMCSKISLTISLLTVGSFMLSNSFSWAEAPDELIGQLLARQEMIVAGKRECAPAVSGLQAWINIPAGSTFAEKGKLNFNALKGKVVVLDFWATWCGPCIHAMPHLNHVAGKYSTQGLQVVTLSKIDEQQDAEKIRTFSKANKMNLPVGIIAQSESEVMKQYHAETIPLSVVLDRQGKVIWSGNPMSLAFDGVLESALTEPDDTKSHDLCPSGSSTVAPPSAPSTLEKSGVGGIGADLPILVPVTNGTTSSDAKTGEVEKQ